MTPSNLGYSDSPGTLSRVQTKSAKNITTSDVGASTRSLRREFEEGGGIHGKWDRVDEGIRLSEAVRF
jgi:hypothetical protein